MTCLDLLLSLEGPELDRSRAHDYIVSERVEFQRTEDVFWAVCCAVNNRLDALKTNNIPDLYDLVCTKTNKMISFFIDIEFGHRSGMTIELVQLLDTVRLPDDYVTLFTTAGHQLLFFRVHKGVDTLLM